MPDVINGFIFSFCCEHQKVTLELTSGSSFNEAGAPQGSWRENFIYFVSYLLFEKDQIQLSDGATLENPVGEWQGFTNRSVLGQQSSVFGCLTVLFFCPSISLFYSIYSFRFLAFTPGTSNPLLLLTLMASSLWKNRKRVLERSSSCT